MVGLFTNLFVAVLLPLFLASEVFLESSTSVDARDHLRPPSPDQQAHPEQPNQPQRRRDSIVGGRLADPGEYPWFVSPDSSRFCGGSLVHEDIVLTAAHCHPSFETGRDLFVGSIVRGSSANGAQQRTIGQKVQHPLYNLDQVLNDYMLVQLTEPVTNAPLIQLNVDPSIPIPGESVTAMGYGATEEGSTQYPTNLYTVDLLVQSHSECAEAYNRLITINETNMLCAGYPLGGRGTCVGDSGGPVITRNGTQVSIVSFGVGGHCETGIFPKVFARTSGAYT